jgi:hypothetical protein
VSIHFVLKSLNKSACVNIFGRKRIKHNTVVLYDSTSQLQRGHILVLALALTKTVFPGHVNAYEVWQSPTNEAHTPTAHMPAMQVQ